MAVRKEWVLEWGQLVGDLSGLSSDRIRETIEDNPVIAEIVGTAWEAAARSADEEKRRLLGKVAAAALRENDNVRLDELQFFARTLRNVDSGHIRLLGTAARLAEVEGKTSRPQLQEAWTEAGEFLTPMLQVLAGEGLIADASNTRQGISFTGMEEWLVDPYGRRFLGFLQD